MNHRLIKANRKQNKNGRVIPEQYRCTCGRWNRTQKTGAWLEQDAINREFERHCAQVGHAIRSGKT